MLCAIFSLSPTVIPGQADEAEMVTQAANADPSSVQACDGTSNNVMEMDAMLQTTLPNATPECSHNIAMELMNEELSVARMVATASRNLVLLPVLLDGTLSVNNMRLQLRTGQRFALVATVAKLDQQ